MELILAEPAEIIPEQEHFAAPLFDRAPLEVAGDRSASFYRPRWPLGLAMLLFIGLGRARKGDTLHCASCGQFIASIDQICRIMDRPPRKTYKNPIGVLCPILTLCSAIGLLADERSSMEHTWFAGYSWRPAEFFGLLEERLISKPASTEPPNEHEGSPPKPQTH